MLDKNDKIDSNDHEYGDGDGGFKAPAHISESDIDGALTCPDAMVDIVSEVVAYFEGLNDSNGNELYNFFHSKKSCELDLAFEIKQLGRNVARHVLEKEAANGGLSQ
mgnify:CR=1 FL=1